MANNHIPLVIYFCSPTCIPCKEMILDFGQIAAQLEPQVRLAIINASSEQEISDRLKVYKIPTLILFRDGLERARIAQSLNLNALTEWIKSLS
jgi:thioredoxin 2